MNIQISYSPRQHLDMQQVMSGAHKHHHQMYKVFGTFWTLYSMCTSVQYTVGLVIW